MKPIYILLLLLSTVINSAAAQEDKARLRSIWKKENIHFNLSLPFANYMYVQPRLTLPFEQGSILGITLGGNYCYSDQVFLSAQAGIANASPVYESFADTLGWEVGKSATAFFVNLRNNHALKWVDFGYGITFGNHMFARVKNNSQLNIDSSLHYRNAGVGACFSAYYKLAYMFYAGVLYQPLLISFSGYGDNGVHHLVSLDLMFRFSIRDKNRKKG